MACIEMQPSSPVKFAELPMGTIFEYECSLYVKMQGSHVNAVRISPEGKSRHSRKMYYPTMVIPYVISKITME